MQIKNIVAAAGLFVLLSLFSFTCKAAEPAKYELTWTYTATNTSSEEVKLVPFKFDDADFALDSPYQPDANFTRELDGVKYSGISSVSVTIPAKSSKTMTDTWTFSGGGFDQSAQSAALEKPPSVADSEVSEKLTQLSAKLTAGAKTNREKALAIYAWITENIVYGEDQDYAEPKTAICETFAALFHDMLTAAGVPDRKVYGYTVKVADSRGNLIFGSSDITGSVMHVWNEFYDETRGWTFVDATFDAGRETFEFFGKCPDNSPHLAMYYNHLQKRYVSGSTKIVTAKTAKLKRLAYADSDPASENLLEVSARHEREAAILRDYGASKGLKFTLDREAKAFELKRRRDFFVPSDYAISLDGRGDLCVIGGGKTLCFQFTQNGGVRKFVR